MRYLVLFINFNLILFRKHLVVSFSQTCSRKFGFTLKNIDYNLQKHATKTLLTIHSCITYFYVKGCFVCMHVCAHVYSGALRGQKRVLNPRELEVLTIVSCYVGAGNQTLILCKSSQCSYPLGRPSSLCITT